MSQELITKIFELCLIPLLTALTGFIIKWLSVKTQEIKTKTDNELAKKYLTMLTDTVSKAVKAVNQTYVDSLKQSGEFTREAQKQALEKAYSAVISALSEDAFNYLNSAAMDFDNYLNTLIEAQVLDSKKEKN